MSESNDAAPTVGGVTGNRVWPMAVLTIVFLSLYLSALIGWLRPISDITMIARLEPILFLIFGYYFGRVPAREADQRLQKEYDHLFRKHELANRQREQSKAEKEAVEEKIRNVRIALRSELSELESEVRSDECHSRSELRGSAHAIETAIKILNS
ncbi:MAG: hypothetical protein ABL984_14070 [Pyrinomonadaceae bacterium]